MICHATTTDRTFMTSPDRILIIDGARTPVGSFGGALKDVPAHVGCR